MVEVTSNTGVTVYGVIRWMGILPGKTNESAGIGKDQLEKVNGEKLETCHWREKGKIMEEKGVHILFLHYCRMKKRGGGVY